ncbi:tfiib zinc-binding [Caudoviricetes sp.]|nr:tfiib zinc-binding [Caudoviricetes sp.]
MTHYRITPNLSEDIKQAIREILAKGVKRADVRYMLNSRAGFCPVAQDTAQACDEYMAELQDQAECADCGEQMSLKRYCEGNTMCYDCEFSFHL